MNSTGRKYGQSKLAYKAATVIRYLERVPKPASPASRFGFAQRLLWRYGLIPTTVAKTLISQSCVVLRT
jgi:hypothetical protein